MFRMDERDRATQAAMAEEIRARLGRLNRSQAWLSREAKISGASWHRYFREGSISREVPLNVIQRIATALGITAGELITLAEENAPRYMPQAMEGITDAERDDLKQAIERRQPKRDNPNGSSRARSQTGS